jgi:hypothetical protein
MGGHVARSTTLAELRKNDIRIVTFNYDRSLEYFLYEAIRNTYNATEVDALTTLNQFGILHVYGSLGDFSTTSGKTTRAYSGQLNRDLLITAANGIRVIPEARDNDRVFSDIANIISWGRRIIYLGFGFDALNMQRLRIPAIVQDMRERPGIFASTLGKTEREVNYYKSFACGLDWGWRTHAAKNTMFLRETGALL